MGYGVDMPYLYLLKYGKYLAVIAILFLCYQYVYRSGYTASDTKWQLIMVRQGELNKKVQKELEAKIQKVESENEQKANELQLQANTYEQKLNDLQSRISNARVIRARGVCKQSENNTANSGQRVPKGEDAKTIDAGAAGNELTPEFRQFLFSNLRRGDEAGIYAKVAYDFLKQHTDKDGNFVCNVTK